MSNDNEDFFFNRMRQFAVEVYRFKMPDEESIVRGWIKGSKFRPGDQGLKELIPILTIFEVPYTIIENNYGNEIIIGKRNFDE